MITGITDQLFRIVYPGYFQDRTYRYYEIRSNLTVTIEDLAYHLRKRISNSLKNDRVKTLYEDREIPDGETDGIAVMELTRIDNLSEEITIAFLNRIPQVQAFLETDLEAFFDGDPAAESRMRSFCAIPGSTRLPSAAWRMSSICSMCRCFRGS